MLVTMRGPGAIPPVWGDFRRPSEWGFGLPFGPAITPLRTAPRAPGPGVGRTSGPCWRDSSPCGPGGGQVSRHGRTVLRHQRVGGGGRCTHPRVAAGPWLPGHAAHARWGAFASRELPLMPQACPVLRGPRTPKVPSAILSTGLSWLGRLPQLQDAPQLPRALHHMSRTVCSP